MGQALPNVQFRVLGNLGFTGSLPNRWDKWKKANNIVTYRDELALYAGEGEYAYWVGLLP